jgi:hypothetical protein
VAGGILVFLLLQKYGKLGAVIRWLAKQKMIGRPFEGVSQQITGVDEALKTLYRERPRVLTQAVGWHMLGHSTGIFQTCWFFSFLHHPVSIAAASAVWVLGMWFDLMTFAVPLNLGSLEGGRIIAFKAIGSSAVLGMTFGIAQRLAQLACACFGLASYAWLTSRENRARAQNLRHPAAKTESGILPGIGVADCKKTSS